MECVNLIKICGIHHYNLDDIISKCSPPPSSTTDCTSPPSSSPYKATSPPHQPTSPPAGSFLSPDMWQTATDSHFLSSSYSNMEQKNACTFVVKLSNQSGHSRSPRSPSPSPQEQRASYVDLSKLSQPSQSDPTSHPVQRVDAQFDMASLSYVHCPKFLDELLDCVSEFRDYVTQVSLMRFGRKTFLGIHSYLQTCVNKCKVNVMVKLP